MQYIEIEDWEHVPGKPSKNATLHDLYLATLGACVMTGLLSLIFF